jgi:steroid 5-alpha reductase family enzyme
MPAEYDHDVVSQAWLLLVIGAACASALMVLMWVLATRLGDASHVDVAWAYGIGGLAVLYALLADGSTTQRLVVAVLVGAWSARLGTYILVNRVIGKPEDGRYQELRRRWAPNVNRAFFVFFQAQAGFVVVFSLAFVFVVLDDGDTSPLLWIGAAIAAASIVGESLADRQLATWRADPANKGKTARNGLWGWSRHPNYFFEWLHWVGWAVISLGSPNGWLAIGVPVFLLALLFRVTGIPETEAQALRSRGDDYRRYQEEVSVFVPLPPRRASR